MPAQNPKNSAVGSCPDILNRAHLFIVLCRLKIVLRESSIIDEPRIVSRRAQRVSTSQHTVSDEEACTRPRAPSNMKKEHYTTYQGIALAKALLHVTCLCLACSQIVRPGLKRSPRPVGHAHQALSSSY